jgi:hypothetical protein
MGTQEKAKRFLEISETHALYSDIVEYVLTYFIARAEKEDNRSFADNLKQAKQTYREDFQKAITVTEEVYCEIFSDEELDELIVMHSTPSIKKLRGLTSGIMSQVLEKYSQQE